MTELDRSGVFAHDGDNAPVGEHFRFGVSHRSPTISWQGRLALFTDAPAPVRAPAKREPAENPPLLSHNKLGIGRP